MAQQHLKNSTHKVNEVFQSAITEAVTAQSRMLIPEFVLLALIEQKNSIALQIAAGCGLDEVTTKTKLIDGAFDSINRFAKKQQDLPPNPQQGLYGSTELNNLFERADSERKNFGDTYISLGTLFLSFFDARQESTREILAKAGLNYEDAKKSLSQIRGNHRVSNKDDETQESSLSKFTRDLTALARRQQLDPVVCRDNEIDRLIQILSRRKKNNPVLIGEPGVGKSVIVEGLVQRIVAQEVPENLLGKRVLSLEMADLVAGAKMHGEFEERLKALRDEIAASDGEIILFIDEIHTVVGAGRTSGALDASNILKTSLANGELRCIGATTIKEYKQYIESDRALERRFQQILVPEPSLEDAKTIITALQPKYEAHHKILYSPESISAAVELSHKYISGRSLPDKAIDLLDEAGALKRIRVVSLPPELQKLEKEKSEKEASKAGAFERQDFPQVAELQMQIAEIENKISTLRKEWSATIQPEDKVVKFEDIAHLVSKSTGIPVGRLQAADFEKLANIEPILEERVIGQHKAVVSVANALRRNRVGLRERKAPIGSFLFLGPTGVGKTELAKSIASLLLNDETRIIRFDMSEFMERHEAAKLIGSPPGYVGYGDGGQLTEKVKRQPFSVVLFDEIEKAHPDVFNMFLQLLDDGRLTDAEGQVINFENTVVIFTSNVGSEFINSQRRAMGLGHQDGMTDDEIENHVRDELKRAFKPEFLNRLDEVIVFRKLSIEDASKIFDLQYGQLKARVAKMGYTLNLRDDAKRFLLEKGYDPVYGARPMRRALEQELENRIAQEIVKTGGQTAKTMLQVTLDQHKDIAVSLT